VAQSVGESEGVPVVVIWISSIVKKEGEKVNLSTDRKAHTVVQFFNCLVGCKKMPINDL
jgi:hypothetical protein